MAKTYAFRLQVRRAEFHNGMVSVPYGSKDDVHREKTVHMTLAEGMVELQRLSDTAPAPHMAILMMEFINDRKPAGFDAAQKKIYKEN